MKVVPGKMYETTFFAGNITSESMVAQAVPSVAPFHAAEYFHKTECFCFEQQELAGGDQLDMPLRFIVDPEMPDSVKTLTLSYTLFDVTEAVRAGAAAE
jgi:cytochrome c oxidase assembly protein subunit 11